MVGNSQDGGATRRLPPWMEGDARSSNGSDEDSCSVKEKLPRRSIKHIEKKAVEVKSVVRQNVAKETRKDTNLPGKDSDEVKREDLGRFVGEGVPRRKRKGKGECEGLEIQCEMGEDNWDLTVGDLLRIAQEYVGAEEDGKPECLRVSECGADTRATRGGSCVEEIRERTAQDMLELLLGPLLKKEESSGS